MQNKNQKKISEVDCLFEIMRWFDKQPRKYIEESLWIKDKGGSERLLKFNNAQSLVDEAIQRQKDRGMPIRIIVVKARREGISTQCAGYTFERTARYENTNSLIISHEQESTEEIFDMSKYFYDKLPEAERPMKKYDNKKRLTFENPDELTKRDNPGLRSKIIIATAGKIRVGRGLNIHCLHGSEVAHWPKAKELMVAVRQSVPNLANTIIILESTSNGIAGRGKFFYDLVNETIAGKTEYTLVFLPWFIMDEYELDNDEKIELDSYEKSVVAEMEKFGIKNKEQQIRKFKWRRWAIPNLTNGDEDQFKQEYPATVQESFIASSGLVIPRQLIDSQKVYIRKPIRVSEEGVEIFEEPTKGHYYSLGGDSSEGEGNDDASFSIFDKSTGREVASFASDRMPPKPFGKLSVKFAKIYNNAMITPEINHPGTAYVDSIKDEYYPNIYRREVEDKISHEKTQKIGFRTTGRTKPNLITNFKTALREEDIGISTEATINQMLTFVQSDEPDSHGTGAAEGEKDDRLMATMLAVEGFKMLP